MASAILATVGVAALNKLLPKFIEHAVLWADKLFGSKTGPIKKNVVTSTVSTAVGELGKVLGPSVSLPQGTELESIIQDTVNALNSSGALQGNNTVIDSAAASSFQPDALRGVAMMLEGATLVVKSASK